MEDVQKQTLPEPARGKALSARAAGPGWRQAALALLGCFLALADKPAMAAGSAERATKAANLTWPAPPDAPRIRFVGSFRSAADFGIKRSGWSKMTGWLTGASGPSEPFDRPFGIGLDEEDGVCITDTGANAVCYCDRKRKLWRRWDAFGKTRFAAPVAVAKRGGAIYVADSRWATVAVLNEDGKLVREIKEGLQRPSGLAVTSNRLFVADAQLQAVRIFDLEGRAVGQWGARGSGPGEFNYPTHLALAAEGSLWVTDSLNGRVQLLDLEGRFLRQVGRLGDIPGRFSRPKGVAEDYLGHLYVVDAVFDNVQLFDGEGRLLMALGETGSEAGQFWLPNGIAINRRNEIFVADTHNRRVQVFQFIGSP